MFLTTAEALPGTTETIVRTILVVEDEAAIRTSAAEFLRDCGYIVIEAGDVREAKDELLNWHVDLVFSDVNMPNRESGFALEKWIRQHHPGVNVLMTSGLPQVAADTKDLREPMIRKPYSYSALLRRIDSMFELGDNYNRQCAGREVRRSQTTDY
jgi:DNA-binding NtrC family response regulator